MLQLVAKSFFVPTCQVLSRISLFALISASLGCATTSTAMYTKQQEDFLRDQVKQLSFGESLPHALRVVYKQPFYTHRVNDRIPAGAAIESLTSPEYSLLIKVGVLTKCYFDEAIAKAFPNSPTPDAQGGDPAAYDLEITITDVSHRPFSINDYQWDESLSVNGQYVRKVLKPGTIVYSEVTYSAVLKSNDGTVLFATTVLGPMRIRCGEGTDQVQFVQEPNYLVRTDVGMTFAMSVAIAGRGIMENLLSWDGWEKLSA